MPKPAPTIRNWGADIPVDDSELSGIASKYSLTQAFRNGWKDYEVLEAIDTRENVLIQASPLGNADSRYQGSYTGRQGQDEAPAPGQTPLPLTHYLDRVSSMFLSLALRATSVKQRYITALEFADPDHIPRRGAKISICHSGELFARMQCQDCGKVIDAPVGGCEDALCPECRKYYSRRKAAEATERIKHFGAGYFKGKQTGYPYAEFTVPDTSWELFYDLKKLSSWYGVVRKSLFEWYDLEVGMVQVVHTNSSKEFWKFKPHIPVQLAGIGYSEDKGWRPLRLYRQEWELRALRAIYTKRMLAAFPSIKREDIHTKDGFLDVNYGYCKTVAVLGERLQYMFRYPSPGRRLQGWAALEPLDDWELLGVATQFLLMQGFRRIRWSGFLATRRGKWLAAQLGIELKPWDSELHENECPYCGGHLKFMGFVNAESRAPPAGVN